MGNNLKYPRRKSRSISGRKYDIDEPSKLVSTNMQKAISSNTEIEISFAQALQQAKINFTKPEFIIECVPGNPDFIVPKYRIAVFCDGDFWHGYNFNPKRIKNNQEFWNAKIRRNIDRDEEVNKQLEKANWTVLRFWEHDIKNDIGNCISVIKSTIKEKLSHSNTNFTFVDLFAGIGGFRIGLERVGGKCIGFSEIDKAAIEVYKKNFIDFSNTEELELGDITKLNKLSISPDLIVGGVPCQSWSIAGKNKGFDDPRGKLWEDSIRVVELNKPKAFIFENVKGLYDPRNRANLDLIAGRLAESGYFIHYKLLNSYDFGLPQNRDRIFIVGIRRDLRLHYKFKFPEPIDEQPKLYNFLDSVKLEEDYQKKRFDPVELFGSRIPASRNRFQRIDELNDFFIFSDTRNGISTIHSWDIIRTTKREKEICMAILKNRRKNKYGNSDGNPMSFNDIKELITNLKQSELEKLIEKNILKRVVDKFNLYNSKNSSGINGIYRIYLPQSDIYSTLTATGTKDYVATEFIHQTNPEDYKTTFIKEIYKTKKYRPIKPTEAGRLQGFPGSFIIHENEKLAHKQFGNAVSVSVIENLAKALIKTKIFSDEH